MIHPIVKYGDPILEKPTKPVEKFDEDFQALVADMFESMYAANGVGLAAPQVGIGLRVTVIDVSNGKNPEAKLVCANPRDHLFRRRAARRGRLPVAARLSRVRRAPAVRHHPRARRHRTRIRNARRRPTRPRFLP